MSQSHAIWQELRRLIRSGDKEGLRALETRVEKNELSEALENAIFAQLAWFRGDRESALERLDEAKSKRDLQPHELLLRGLIHLDKSELSEARELLSAAAEHQLEDPRLPSALAGVSIAEGNHKEAMRYLEEALALDPAHWHARFLLGTVYEARNDPESASSYFERVTQSAPQYEPAWRGYVTALLKLDNAKEALRIVEPVAQSNPQWVRVQLLYVEALKRNLRTGDAIRILAPIARGSNKAELHLELAELFLQEGKLDGARSILEQIGANAPSSARVSLLKGVVKEAEGPASYHSAREHYQEALKAQPDDWRALNALGGLLSKDTPLRDPEEAERLLRSALAMRPNKVEPRLNLGLLLAREGQQKEAKDMLAPLLQDPRLDDEDRAQIKQSLDSEAPDNAP